jgi:tetratricopeptide (TPR) repeat protein
MKNLRFAWLVLLSTLFVSSCAVSKFDGSNASLRSAVLRGEIKDALAFYEAEAQQAEKDATSSSFPQQYWGAAVGAYLQAADAARFAGQLQNAIAYGEKALEIAQRTKAPVFARGDNKSISYPPFAELYAILGLINTYESVRDFDKARVLVDRGLTLLKEIPSGDPARLIGKFQDRCRVDC